MSSDPKQIAAQGFREAYGRDPALIVTAPGRVNILGGHVDYSDGFVLPVPVDRELAIAASAREDNQIRLRSASFDEAISFRTGAISADGTWGDFPKGIVRAHALRREPVGGFDAFFASNVPIGGGISSSAAVDVATSSVLQQLFDFHVPGPEVAQLSMDSDNEFVGIRCGIMDQFVSAMGRAGHLLFLDCRSLEFEYVPIDLETYRIVVMQSGVERGLRDSEFNDRRAQCEEGVAVVAKRHPEVRALRDVTPTMLEEASSELSEVCYRRCRHGVEEIARVVEGAAALRAGDMNAFAEHMYASHESSKMLYEVTIPELDALIDASRDAPGSAGGRVTGAGFGGCTVHLAEANELDTFIGHVSEAFQRQFDRRPDYLVCRSSDGAFVGDAA